MYMQVTMWRVFVYQILCRSDYQYNLYLAVYAASQISGDVSLILWFIDCEFVECGSMILDFFQMPAGIFFSKGWVLGWVSLEIVENSGGPLTNLGVNWFRNELQPNLCYFATAEPRLMRRALFGGGKNPLLGWSFKNGGIVLPPPLKTIISNPIHWEGYFPFANP